MKIAYALPLVLASLAIAAPAAIPEAGEAQAGRDAHIRQGIEHPDDGWEAIGWKRDGEHDRNAMHTDDAWRTPSGKRDGAHVNMMHTDDAWELPVEQRDEAGRSTDS